MTIPRAPGLNKRQSAIVAHPPRVCSVFPQGTAPSQPPHPLCIKTGSTNLLKQNRVSGVMKNNRPGGGNQSRKIPRMKNIPLCSLMLFFVFLCLRCYSSCMFMSLVGCFPRHKSSVILIGCVQRATVVFDREAFPLLRSKQSCSSAIKDGWLCKWRQPQM